MTCPKCQKAFSKVTAHECPVSDTYICPECRVGLSDGVTDWIKVEAELSDNVFTTEGRLF